jgi:hypothetical protein
MKSPYILAALLAFGVVGCTKTEVTPAPSTTTKIEVKPAEAPTAPPASSTVVVTPPATTPPATTETTKSTTLTTPSGATTSTTTTETKK